MPLKQVITIILLAVILGTGAEYFFIIRNGGDPFADIVRLTAIMSPMPLSLPLFF